MKMLFWSAGLAGALVLPVSACDLCSVYSASLARGELGSGFFGGVAEQFTHFGTLQRDGRMVPNEVNQYLDSSISQVLFGYNVSPRYGFQVNLPVIYRSFRRPEGFDIDRGTEAGLGDASLLAHFNAFRHDGVDTTVSWNVLGGIKLPTGSSDRLREEFHEEEVPGAPESGIHGHDLALGTGSVDGLVGTGIYLRWKRAFWIENVQYTIRSEGDFGYQFANDLTWSGGPGVYVLLSHSYTVGLQFNISGEHKGLDHFQGEPAEDTGVTSVYLGPRLFLTWGEHFSAELGGEIPVSIDNTALQAVPDYRIRASVNWHF